MALQMGWQPSLLRHKRKNGPPLGLKNLGNSCYLNSVLQCLTYTPPLANFCLNNQHSSNCDSTTESERKRECPFCILEKRIVRSLSVDLTLDTPAKINNCLRIFAEHFRFGRQEDAHEFLRYVIDACHNACLRLKKLQQQRRKVGVNYGGEGFSGSTVVKEIFGGSLQSQVKCLSCGTESNKVDEIMDISLDVLHSSSLKESLQNFFRSEVLEGNNKYKCENCKKLVAARKQMSIFQAPNVLVIQLKRFEGIFGGKIDKTIPFDEVLVLSSYVGKASQDSHPEYNLFGTIVHSGFSPDSGHYYAYIKDAMGRWYRCNDSYVSLSTLQEVLSEKVYILFFSRTKQRPVPASTVSASNGVKSQYCSGSHSSKIPKADSSVRTMYAKQFVDHSSENNSSTKSKVDTNPSSSEMKVSSGKSGAPNFPASVNGKIVVNKKQSNEKNGDVRASICSEKSERDMALSISSNGVCKSKAVDAVNGGNCRGFPLKQSNENNGDMRASIFKEKGEKYMTSSISSNGVCKNKTVDAVGGEKSQGFPLRQSNEKYGDVRASICREKSERNMASSSSNGICKSKTDGENRQGFPLENGNDKSQRTCLNSIEAGICMNNDKKNRVTIGSGTNHHNGGVNCSAYSSKRKSRDEDSCILFAEDDNSRPGLEELKKVLWIEASSVLRSNGWLDEVCSFMRSRKKLCAQELGNAASNGDELKKLLITHSKQTFISQIPESLKENLIERLRIASQEKQYSDP